MATNQKINGHDYFRIRKVIGHKYVNGVKKPVLKSFYGKSKGDAKRKYDEWLETNDKEKDLTSFGELAKFYTENVLAVSSKYATGTIERYTSYWRTHIDGTDICNICISDLTAIDIQVFYNKLNVSASTMKGIHKFMAALFKWLSLNDRCSYLLSAVELPKKKDTSSHQIVVWTDEELDAITASISECVHGDLLTFEILTGLRFSEIIALQWKDIDDNYILHVQRQLYNGEIKAPKANSFRDIPLHPVLQDLIRNKKHTCKWIFPSASGTPLNVSNVTKSIKRYYDKIGVPRKKFHAYRATFCTRLCRAGVPIQTASKLMGHKSIEVTAQYYTDISLQEKTDAVKLLKI